MNELFGDERHRSSRRAGGVISRGAREAGLPEFRVANLIRDRAVLELAKVEAARFAAEPDPAISPTEKDAVWARLKLQWQRKYGLVEA